MKTEVFREDINGMTNRVRIQEREGKFSLLILDLGATDVSAEELIKLGTKITMLGFHAIDKLPDRDEIMDRCEAEGRAFSKALKAGD